METGMLERTPYPGAQSAMREFESLNVETAFADWNVPVDPIGIAELKHAGHDMFVPEPELPDAMTVAILNVLRS